MRMRKLHTPCRSGQKRRGIDPHRVQLWPRGRGMVRKQPRRRKFPRAALVLLLLIVAGCTFAAWLTPYEVSVMDGQAISLAPCLAHPLGTDSLGRDLLAMLLYGGRLSLYIGLLSALLSSLLALVYGAISGLAPGALEMCIRDSGYPVILDGTNASDDANDRPGMQALAELRVLSPLRLCGLTKDEIRRKSREAGLFTWDKPAYACLATRIPSGMQISEDLLQRVEGAEGALFAMGFTDFRVRVREGGALLQFHRAQMEEARARRAEITEKLKPWFPVLLPDWEVR